MAKRPKRSPPRPAAESSGRKPFAARNRLPETATVQITGTNRDGEAIAKPVDWAGDGPPPQILMTPEPRGRPALAPRERVLARLRPIGAGKYEGRTIKRLTDEPGRIVGIYRPGIERGGVGRVIPTDRRAKAEWIVPAGESLDAEAGEIVSAAPLPSTGFGLSPVRVTERLGRIGDARSVSLIVIATHEIPTEFPAEAVAQAEGARAATLRGREDLRGVPLITIDGADARDFDDAVWAEPDGEGHRLIVAIADVAHYVRPGTALDDEAWKRGNSCYFPDRVVPMLPEALSNGWCSLRPERGSRLPVRRHAHRRRAERQDRSHRFGRGLMRSAARLTYEDRFRRARDVRRRDRRPDRARCMRPSSTLLAARTARGTLDLDLAGTKDHRWTTHGKVASDRSPPPPRQPPADRGIHGAGQCVRGRGTGAAGHRPCMYRIHPPPTRTRSWRRCANS